MADLIIDASFVAHHETKEVRESRFDVEATW